MSLTVYLKKEDVRQSIIKEICKDDWSISRISDICKSFNEDDLDPKQGELTDALLNTIVESATLEFGVKRKQLFSKLRHRDVATARYCISFILRKEYGCKLQEIGDILKRNYTTINHGINQIESLLSYDKETRSKVNKVLLSIGKKLREK